MKAKPLKRSHGGSSNPTESGRLLNYRGTMANVPLYKPGLFYFELAVQYRVTRLIRRGSLFEVALARLGVVDKHHSVDCFPYAWAVSARGCHVCGKSAYRPGTMASCLPTMPFLPERQVLPVPVCACAMVFFWILSSIIGLLWMPNPIRLYSISKISLSPSCRNHYGLFLESKIPSILALCFSLLLEMT